LTANKDKLETLATLLLDREVIFREDLEEIFGKRPWDKEEEKEKMTINIPSDIK
jgi:cell division protease FtsH